MISVSDIPGGVINIMYGSQETLGMAMAQHPVISGLWYPQSLKGVQFEQSHLRELVGYIWAIGHTIAQNNN